MVSEIEHGNKNNSIAKYIAGLLLLTIIILIATKPSVLFPPFLQKNQCHICFKQATHSNSYILSKDGNRIKEFEEQFCDSHGGGIPGFDASKSLEGRGRKIFLIIAMIVLPFCFLWGCFKIFFIYKTPSFVFWLLCFPLFFILLGICFYMLHLELAGRMISWIMFSLLMIIWTTLFAIDNTGKNNTKKF